VVALASATAVWLPSPAAADTTPATAAALDVQVQAAAARVNELRRQLSALSASLTRAEDRVARLDSQLRWTDGSLTHAQQATLGIRGAVARRDGQRRRLAAATRALQGVEAGAAAHPVLTQLVSAKQHLKVLTARRRALAALTRGAWAASLLDALGAPRCQSNLTAVVSWETAENTAAAWNPLATTLRAPGSVAYNHARVQDYPTSAEGLSATVDTLRLGYYAHGYGWIWYRLTQCAPAAVTVQAINDSDWCHGCARGGYVTDTLPDVAADYVDRALLPVAAATP
jgi:hypothetical protein